MGITSVMRMFVLCLNCCLVLRLVTMYMPLLGDGNLWNIGEPEQIWSLVVDLVATFPKSALVLHIIFKNVDFTKPHI